ncbi:signal peptidase I [Cellulomonas wangsupingiae]|uniref:Signal peptidase I n=1 Tax=Cellulomonas wangsupingiae TaxID=2968085 RepID=A0ABY5K3G1_9CELL|nr:signal peptidase I [Cellulomonas wangsupingiae]MCC2333735.1 signal peptidase I [Cellulomonas wangsupingiae]MCM0639446.1 signal peptidase I [Cellulomonas wangsupingiae]UUI64997.1 signal peptidase I [Cellulomonas wangsupingiae]
MTTTTDASVVPTTGDAAGAPRRAGRVGSALLTAVMVVLLLVAAVVTVVPRLIGAVPLTVLSGSMEPTISAGDLVVVRPTDPADLRIGDVVTVQPVSDDPTLVTHRIVGVTHGSDGIAGFVTQGDANEHADEPVVPEQVMGRVVYTVPLVGHVTHGTWGPYVAAAVGVGLVVYGVVMVALPRRDREEVRDGARP